MNDILVSVSVISYNSEKTILETLESIKSQTYQNIELIVSDDCSQDKTVEITEQWIAENRERFARVELLTIDHNTGISANANRALRACNGEWMKGIAADDILFPQCIEDCMAYVNTNAYIAWLSGKVKVYQNVIDETHLVQDSYFYSQRRMQVLTGDIEVQKENIINWNYIIAPAVFIRTAILINMGGYDEQYEMFEDWPMWKKLLDAGYRCFFFNEYIVGYRINNASVSISQKFLFNMKLKESAYLFYKKELFQYYSLSKRTNQKLHYFVCLFFQRFRMNNTHWFNRKFYNGINWLIDSIF